MIKIAHITDSHFDHLITDRNKDFSANWTVPDNKNLFDIGIISLEALDSNKKIISEIEKSLFEKFDKELKVKEIKIRF